MQFSYIDPDVTGGLLGSLINELRGAAIEVTNNHDLIPEVELPEEWENFRKTLFNFQMELFKTKKELSDLVAITNATATKLTTLRSMANMFNDSQELKGKLDDIITQFEIDNNVAGNSEKIAELKAVIYAQRKVLENTNAEQQVKYQCFVCMERPVDICLDPCGHVLCLGCWNRLPTHDRKCPGCRTATRKTIKIFTL